MVLLMPGALRPCSSMPDEGYVQENKVAAITGGNRGACQHYRRNVLLEGTREPVR